MSKTFAHFSGRTVAVNLIMIFSLNLVSVYAEPRKINMNDCILVALQNNPDILETEEERKKSIADYQIAKAQRGLKVDGQIKTVERLKSDSSSDPNVRIPGKDTDIGLFAGLYAYYYLYDAKRTKNEDVARVGLTLTKIETEKIKSEIIYNVRKAYIENLLAQDNLVLRDQLLKNAEEKQRLVNTLYNNGLQPAIDVTQANVSYAQAMFDFERAKNTEKNQHSALLTAMGLQTGGDFILTPLDSKNLPHVKYSSGELDTLASLYSPELRIFEEKKKIAKLEIEAARAEARPSVFITMGLGMENEALYLFDSNADGEFSDNFRPGNWGPIFTATITATMPVYYGGGIVATVDSKVVDYNRIVYQERSAQIKIKNSIERQYESMNELNRQIILSKLLLESSEKHHLLARRSYENGIGSLLDLQNAEAGVINSQIEYTKCIYEYYLTLALLCYTIGVDEERICQK